MSFKAKDLTYDSSQPTFLRRLRGELTGEDASRHDRPMPRNKRLKQDEEDDAPTYVLEDTNQSLSKAEYEAMLSGKDPKEHDAEGDENKLKPEASVIAPKTGPPKDNIAELGNASRKRKVAKVVGAQAEDEANEKKRSKPTKKPKKKAKAVKLTFGNEED